MFDYHRKLELPEQARSQAELGNEGNEEILSYPSTFVIPCSIFVIRIHAKKSKTTSRLWNSPPPIRVYPRKSAAIFWTPELCSEQPADHP